MSTIPFHVDENIQAELAALDGAPMRPVRVELCGGPGDGLSWFIEAIDGDFVSGQFRCGGRWHEYRSKSRVAAETETIRLFHKRIYR